MDRKSREESAMRDQLRQRKDLRHYDAAWSEVAVAEERRAGLLLPDAFIDSGRAFATPLFSYARAWCAFPLKTPSPIPNVYRNTPRPNAARSSIASWLKFPFIPSWSRRS